MVDVEAVRLTFDGRRISVPTEAFGSPELVLNRGYLQRWRDHVTGSHQDRLREAVAERFGCTVGDVAAVRLTMLSTAGVVQDTGKR